MAKEGIGKKLKREVVRAMLERTQGMDMSKMASMMGGTTYVPYDNVEETLNIPYVNRDEVPLAMDMFKPIVPEGTELPVAIVIHGGGLTMGDRGFARPYARRLAHLNYLVFSLEYRLAPRANVCQELDDVCAGMDLVGKMLVDHDVDLTRIFLVADSAGAYLSAYVSAMHGSRKLCEVIGHEPSRMNFAAIGLMSGMFYTNRKDPTGWMLSEQIYGEKRADERFLKYMDPENPEIIKNVPPTFLLTSRGDFMNNYTFMFHEALKKAGRPTKLLYFGDESLQHVFAISDPENPKSIEATDKMLAWFEEQARLKTQRSKKDPTVTRRRKKLEKRLEDGTINDQKVWSYIKERRSFDPKLLELTALIDCTGEYTYSEMFDEWDKYARVFTALDITAGNHSRAAIAGAITAEPLFAFYGLNMTGAQVSMFSYPDLVPGGSWRTMLEKEKITDLIIADIMVTPDLWKELQAAKKELGLRNIILLHSKMGGPCVGPAELVYNEMNYHYLATLPDTLFMADLVEKYADTPIFMDKSKGDDIALIMHTSGTTRGTRKPLPYTNRSVNNVASSSANGFRRYADSGKAPRQLRTLLHFDFSSFLAMGGLVNANLAAGETIVLTFFGFMHPKFIRAVDYYDIDTLVLGGFMVDKWLERTDIDDVSFSSVKVLGLGGSYIPPEKMKKYDEFFKAHGCKCSINNGYGMSETGGSQLMVKSSGESDTLGSADNADDIMRIKDDTDGEFYTASQGARSGILYLSSNSMAENELDGEKLFDFTEINGRRFICTNDMVRVNEDGTISYSGRADKYFVNNEGKKFDSGLVDTAMSCHPAVSRCAVVPVLEKRIHDTVPVLYVVAADRSDNAPESIRQALADVYVNKKELPADDLPVQFMLVDDIPLNSSGKLDIFRVTRQRLQGRAYNIIPVFEGNELTDIKTEFVEKTSSMTAGTLPEGMGGGSAYDLFDLFNTPPKKEEQPAGAMPFMFPFGMMNCFGKPEDKEMKMPDMPEGLMKLGNKLIGKLYSARDIDFDIED
ncbi:AMP-binding protein [Ruminococcus sp.]|uniref:AMP-binding protein n=1 Tax=Ruminococcus sp. TaxID=41978 RepID=UPI0025EC66E8|nr:AMP-binding protein [Ruminococcus sp.]MBQ8965690.1 AMP-binding protein [Ruminococcus sp.]